MFFRFPPDARWNPEPSAVEFSIGVGEYEGVVRIPRRVFQALLDQAATPERCLEAYHLQRTRLELITERKVRRRQSAPVGWYANAKSLRVVPEVSGIMAQIPVTGKRDALG